MGQLHNVVRLDHKEPFSIRGGVNSIVLQFWHCFFALPSTLPLKSFCKFASLQVRKFASSQVRKFASWHCLFALPLDIAFQLCLLALPCTLGLCFAMQLGLSALPFKCAFTLPFSIACLLCRWDYRHDTRMELAHFRRHRSFTGGKKQYRATPGQSPGGPTPPAGGSRRKEVAEHHRGIDKSNPVAAAVGKVRWPILPCPAMPPLARCLPQTLSPALGKGRACKHTCQVFIAKTNSDCRQQLP